MRRPARPRPADPHLLVATAGAAAVVVLGIVALGATGSVWVLAITMLAALAATALLTLDVENAADDGAAVAQRLLVLTSDPVDPRTILRVATADDPDLPLDSVGVMVVSPEGFRPLEPAGGEPPRAQARRAEEATVAGLRRAGITAAGHVGAHDPARAVDEALVLFPADRTFVFAQGRLAEAYRRRLGDRPVEVIELPAEPALLRARSRRP